MVFRNSKLTKGCSWKNKQIYYNWEKTFFCDLLFISFDTLLELNAFHLLEIKFENVNYI